MGYAQTFAFTNVLQCLLLVALVISYILLYLFATSHILLLENILTASLATLQSIRCIIKCSMKQLKNVTCEA